MNLEFLFTGMLRWDLTGLDALGPAFQWRGTLPFMGLHIAQGKGTSVGLS